MKLFILTILTLISFPNTNDCVRPGDKLFIDENIAYYSIDEEIIFSSNPDWKVQQVFCSDFDDDGEKEIALSLWKKGNFGNAKPFWIKEDDDSYKMHLFLYKLENKTLKAFWHSSNLPKQNLFLLPYKNKIFALEKTYNTIGLSLAKVEWKNWGFEIVERKEILY